MPFECPKPTAAWTPTGTSTGLSRRLRMEALVGGSWDEQFFYRNFYIYGCGGMFGTELHLKDEEACRSETASISVTTDAKGEPTGAVPMVFSCCGKQGGCSASSALSPRLAAFAVAAAAALLLLT